MDTLGDRLLWISRELARAFHHVPTPPALAWALHGSIAFRGPQVMYDLGDPDARIAILAGPRSLYFRDELHEVAAHLSAPVANTWGAKGILPWDSPHHMGTCGLQARDYELLGLAEYDAVLTVGLDPAESPTERYSLTRVVDLHLSSLRHLTDDVARRHHEIRPNALYERIAAVAQPGYVDERTPRHPARAVMGLKQSLAPGTVVAAQPGEVGLWVARTFPTDAPGTVFVPAVDAPGIAAAIALLAAAEGRSAVAVVPAPIDALTEALVEAAEARSTPFRLDVWGDDVDLGLTSLLVEAAGPVVAWRP